MQITVSGHHMIVTDSLRDYAREKVGRIQKHFEKVTNTNIVLHMEKNRCQAEGTLCARGAMLHANAVSSNMYAAIDDLANKLDKQVLKYKEKRSNHHKMQRVHNKHDILQ